MADLMKDIIETSAENRVPEEHQGTSASMKAKSYEVHDEYTSERTEFYFVLSFHLNRRTSVTSSQVQQE